MLSIFRYNCYSCYSILECHNLLFGVKLSIYVLLSLSKKACSLSAHFCSLLPSPCHHSLSKEVYYPNRIYLLLFTISLWPYLLSTISLVITKLFSSSFLLVILLSLTPFFIGRGFLTSGGHVYPSPAHLWPHSL